MFTGGGGMDPKSDSISWGVGAAEGNAWRLLGGAVVAAPCLPSGHLGPVFFSWVPYHVQHPEGESGGCMFVCVLSHTCTCAQVYTYVGGVYMCCMCECCLWVEGGPVLLSCSLHTGMASSSPALSLELTLGQR